MCLHVVRLGGQHVEGSSISLSSNIYKFGRVFFERARGVWLDVGCRLGARLQDLAAVRQPLFVLTSLGNGADLRSGFKKALRNEP